MVRVHSPVHCTISALSDFLLLVQKPTGVVECSYAKESIENVATNARYVKIACFGCDNKGACSAVQFIQRNCILLTGVRTEGIYTLTC